MKGNINKAIIEREEFEILNLTFHPQINPISNFFGSRGVESTEDYLMQKGVAIKDKLNQKRNEALYFEQTNWSFQPKINENSRKIIENKGKIIKSKYFRKRYKFQLNYKNWSI